MSEPALDCADLCAPLAEDLAEYRECIFDCAGVPDSSGPITYSCYDFDPDSCDVSAYKDVYFRLENNCDDYDFLFCNAYKVLIDNYDIIRSWFNTVGKSGNAYRRHFNGRTRTVFQCGGVIACDILGTYAMGVPPGIAVCDWYLDTLVCFWATATTDEKKCLIVDLAAVIAHEMYHITGHTGERTAWSLEAWVRVLLAQRLCVSGATYCCTTDFPSDGNWKDELSLDEIKGRVAEADNCSGADPSC